MYFAQAGYIWELKYTLNIIKLYIYIPLKYLFMGQQIGFIMLAKKWTGYLVWCSKIIFFQKLKRSCSLEQDQTFIFIIWTLIILVE